MREIAPETAPSKRTSGDAVTARGSAAERAAPLVEPLLGAAPVRLELWDGTSVGPGNATCAIRLRSPDALRRVLWSPGELGVARAFGNGTVGSSDRGYTA